MKAAFHIIPENTEKRRHHLLIEVGTYGISFAWFTRDPISIHGIAVYNFTDVNSPLDIINEIEQVFRSNTIYDEGYASVSICYDVKQSVLVPGKFYTESTAGPILQLMHDFYDGFELETELVKGIDCFNIYAIEKGIKNFFSARFPGARCCHTASLEIKQSSPFGKQLRCIIFHNCIRVALFDERGLKFSGQFHYDKPVDAAYYLLNCCEQYGIDPTQLNLRLSGMVEINSNLYNELYKYFSSIEFVNPDPGIVQHERIQFYPPHFFSHLTGLVSCVS